MRDLLLVGEDKLLGLVINEIYEAIRGATSGERRRGRSKMNPPSTNENEAEDSNAANSSSVREENERPRRQEGDTDPLCREFDQVIQDVGLGDVEPGFVAMGMEEDLLMLSQDTSNMQLFAFGDYGERAGEPYFYASGSYGKKT